MKPKTDYTKILAWAKKIKAIEISGGKCQLCNDDNLFHLIFHHSDPNEKECTIASLRGNRWSKIENELKKCILLCQNCHRELHKKLDNDNSRFNENKRIFLEFKNVDCCVICGYNKYNGSLSFHHKYDKEFTMNRVMESCKSVDELGEYITNELNKCDVLCSNCHIELHTDKSFFEMNKNEIYEKSKKIKENTPKINKEIVKKMYFEEGKRQIDIVNYFGCKKGTISGIIKKLKQHAGIV